jgi:hypothetical protein
MTLDTSNAVASDLTRVATVGDNKVTIGVYDSGQFFEKVENCKTGHWLERAISPGEYRRLDFVLRHTVAR